jgi:hypothetical protein
MCALRVQGDRLLGKRHWYNREWREITPDEIWRVSERWWPNPILEVTTGTDSYTVLAWRKDFEEVVGFLETTTPFEIRRNLLHRYILFWFGQLRFRRRRGPIGGSPLERPGIQDRKDLRREFTDDKGSERKRIPLKLEHPALTLSGGLVTLFCAAVIPILRWLSELARIPLWAWTVTYFAAVIGIIILVTSMRTAASRESTGTIGG